MKTIVLIAASCALTFASCTRGPRIIDFRNDISALRTCSQVCQTNEDEATDAFQKCVLEEPPGINLCLHMESEAKKQACITELYKQHYSACEQKYHSGRTNGQHCREVCIDKVLEKYAARP